MLPKNKMVTDLNGIRAQLDAALKTIGDKYGYKISAGRATYNPAAGNFTMKVEGVANGGLSKEGLRYKSLYTAYGLPPLDTILSMNGKQFKIVGLRTTKVIVQSLADNKNWLYPIDTVAAFWKLAEAKI